MEPWWILVDLLGILVDLLGILVDLLGRDLGGSWWILVDLLGILVDLGGSFGDLDGSFGDLGGSWWILVDLLGILVDLLGILDIILLYKIHRDHIGVLLGRSSASRSPSLASSESGSWLRTAAKAFDLKCPCASVTIHLW